MAISNISSKQQIADLFDSKVRSGLFKKLPGYITSDFHRDDRIQEGLCQTFEQFAQKAQSTGQIMEDALLFHAARKRATDYARKFIRGDHVHSRRDAMDPRAYHSGDVELCRIDWWHFEEGGPDLLACEGRMYRDDPEQLTIAKLDSANWWKSLSQEDQELLRRRANGQTLQEISEDTGHNITWLSRRFKSLRGTFCEWVQV